MTSYSEYIIEAKPKMGKFGLEIFFSGEHHYKTNFSVWFAYITAPVLMEDKPHKHDFDMYLFFLGTDNVYELCGEIELGLGGEVYVITTPSSVYVPKGLVHCPLNFRKVEKPILFIHVIMADTYRKEEVLD